MQFFVKKVKNISVDDLKKIIDEIPDDWDISDGEKRALIIYIYERFQRIDQALELLNLKEGV